MDNTTPPIKINHSSINDEMVQTVNARDLHTFLEIGKKFADWIKDRIKQYAFDEDIDYVTFSQNRESGGKLNEYALSIDMAKELSMVERNDKGKEARLYFIACEKQVKEKKVIDFSAPETIIGVISAQGEKIEEQAAQIEAQVIQIEQAKPKVSFFDQFLNADGLYGLQNAARALNCRPNLFIRWLKSEYLFYQGGNLVAKVRYTQMGIFEVRTFIVDDKARPQSYITPKGIKYLESRVPEEIKLRNAS